MFSGCRGPSKRERSSTSTFSQCMLPLYNSCLYTSVLRTFYAISNGICSLWNIQTSFNKEQAPYLLHKCIWGCTYLWRRQYMTWQKRMWLWIFVKLRFHSWIVDGVFLLHTLKDVSWASGNRRVNTLWRVVVVVCCLKVLNTTTTTTTTTYALKRATHRL